MAILITIGILSLPWIRLSDVCTHVLPKWIKLFIDGTVEGGTGYCAVPYPDSHEGIVNWKMQEVADITSEANKNCGLSMHIHTMGDMAAHNITVPSGMLWHQGAWYLPIGMYL